MFEGLAGSAADGFHDVDVPAGSAAAAASSFACEDLAQCPSREIVAGSGDVSFPEDSGYIPDRLRTNLEPKTSPRNPGKADGEKHLGNDRFPIPTQHSSMRVVACTIVDCDQ